MSTGTLDWRRQRAEEFAGKAIERRTFAADLECRAGTAEGDGWTLTGHSAVWGVPYQVGHFVEQVEAGAARRSLSNNPDITLLLNHGDGGSGLPLARTKSGTMTVSEDNHGLLVVAKLDKADPDSQILKRKLDRGDLDGQMSIGFTCIRDEWDSSYEKRILKQIELNRGDCSIVTQAASPTTSAEMRAFETEVRSKYSTSELEKLGNEGKALWLDDHWAFPTKTRDDFDKAVKMVPLSNTPAAKIKAYLRKRANAEGWPIPESLQRAASCETCGGSRFVGCADCNPDGTYMAPIVSVATDGRSALDGLPSLDSYRKRAGLASPVEQSLRRSLAAEQRRKRDAEQAKRAGWLADYRSELERAGAVRRERERLLRSGRR